MANTFTVEVASSKIENFEDVLQKTGGFGKFQFLVLVLLLSLEIPASFLLFSPIFVGSRPAYWLCDNVTLEADDVCNCNGTLSTPFSSIVSEWNLICDNEWISDFITGLQLLGMFMGSTYGSQFSDWYGRKIAYVGASLIMVLGTAVSAAAPNVYVFAFARFVCGAGYAAFSSISLIYSMEFLTPKWRPLSSSVGPLGEGTMLLGAMAYFIPSWRNLLWATLIPFVLLIVIYPVIPESPRWLLRNQKIEEGQKVLNFIAKINRTAELDSSVLKGIAQKEKEGSCTDKIKKITYIQFLKEKTLRRTTICLAIIWSAFVLIYFGISYNIKNVGGSPYLNVIIMGLSDSIAYPMAFFVNSRLGRRKALMMFMTLTASFLTSLAVLYLTLDMNEYAYAVVAFCFLGKFAAAGSRSSLRTLTGESYPTSMRNMSFGFMGMFTCPASLMAPLLAFLGARWPSVPFFALAVLSVAAAFVSFMLREMKGQPLQNEIRQKNSYYQTVSGNNTDKPQIQELGLATLKQ